MNRAPDRALRPAGTPGPHSLPRAIPWRKELVMSKNNVVRMGDDGCAIGGMAVRAIRLIALWAWRTRSR